MAPKLLVHAQRVVSDKAGPQTQLSVSKADALGIQAWSQRGLLDAFPAPGPMSAAMAERQETPTSPNLRV